MALARATLTCLLVMLVPRLGTRLVIDVLNLFDTQASDIDYFYQSRLPGEPAAGVADIHMHPLAPRTARVSLHFDF